MSHRDTIHSMNSGLTTWLSTASPAHAAAPHGTSIALVLFVSYPHGQWWLFPLALIPGYGAAWIGHFFIEKNKPATFQYPLWSLWATTK